MKRKQTRKKKTTKGQSTRGQKEVSMVRSIKALDLRCQGFSYSQIASKLGVARGTAYKHVQKVLDTQLNERGEIMDKMREVENSRLDMIWLKIFPGVMSCELLQNKTNGNGKKVKEKALVMSDDFFKAVQLLLRISQRRSRLNGLDITNPDLGDVGDGQSPELKQVINIFNVMREQNPKALDAALEAFQAPPVNGERSEQGAAQKETNLHPEKNIGKTLPWNP